jgi:type II secretory pathway pseudopilin PulG
MARAGFTLVEMLVAVGLVVLMMALFAQIFQFATATMGAQKGTAENDQKVRLVQTLLRSDISNRSVQIVNPFISGAADPYSMNLTNTDDRQGYLYIAENDPDDDTDDVLQLTVKLPVGEDPFYGAARVLLPTAAGIYGAGGATYYPNASGTVPPTGQPGIANPGNYWVNQPEFDDGILGLPNGAASSPVAEVSYFLRKGTLYRRINLIRTVPIQATMPPDPQPTDNLLAPLAPEFYGPPPGASQPRNFYSYFDFAAYWDGAQMKFHGANTAGATMDNTAAGSANALGKPPYRFGHNWMNGLPREFIGTNYIGRFTHEETSFMSTTGAIQFFGYPGKVGAQGSTYPNPMDDNPATGALLTYDTNTGKVNEYKGGSRTGEDILMTNVMRFDIKVWDDAAGLGPDGVPGFAANDTVGVPPNNFIDDDQNGTNNDASEIGWPGSDDGAFVDVGHQGFIFGGIDRAFYSRNRLANNFYCPQNPNKSLPADRLYRFDTWHPTVNIDGAAGDDQAPFRAPDVPPIGANPAIRRPLKAIQIKITFLDPTTQQLRDITAVHSLKPSGP